MDSSRSISVCDSIGWAANVHGKLIEDHRYPGGNHDGDEAASAESGNNDHSTVESNLAVEVPRSISSTREAMGGRTASMSSGSKSEQREDFALGMNGETSRTSGRSSKVEERPTTRNSGGGSQSSAGGGKIFFRKEEEDEQPPPPPSSPIHDNAPAKAGGVADNGDTGGNIPNTTGLESAPVDNISGGQKLPSNLFELARRLSESLGMAVATVLHEVFERSGDFGTRPASPVDELSGLLGAALKESLILVLGNDHRTVFLESFRSSFRSTYQTMRSVRRAFAKSGGRLTPSAREQYPNSWQSLPSKARRGSPSRSYREKSRKTLEDTYDVDLRKRYPMVGNGRANRRNNGIQYPNYAVGSIFEEEIASFTPTKYGQQGQRRPQSPCSSSATTCLNDSLQSTFFTSSTLEPEGHSDTAASRSSKKSCSNESLNSSLVTSSNPELAVRGQQDDPTRSCSVNSVSDSMESLLSYPTPDTARDVHSKRLDTEDSWDVNMFSATSSTESGDELVVVDRDEVIHSVRDQNKSGFVVTFDSWTSKNDHKHSRRVVEFQANSLPVRRAVVDSIQDTIPVGSSGGPGRGISRDSLQYTKLAVGSCVGHEERCASEGSIQQTEPVGSSDSFGDHSQNFLRPGTCASSGRASSCRMRASNTLNLAKPRIPQAMTLVGSAETGESSSISGEPGSNMEHTSRRGADLFGRLHLAEEGNNENNMLVHSRLGGQVWDDVTRLGGPSLEDTLLPPFMNYGVRNRRQALLERYVEAQETQNHLKSLEIAHSMKLLIAKKDHLQLQSESNALMRENVHLGRSKIDLKEFELEDRKLTAAHRELSQMCADELVAGLCVMLLALTFSAWRFSYSRLSRVVAMCQLPPREPRSGGWLGANWMANRIDAVTWQMQALSCEVTKAGRMLVGLILIAFVTSSLIRRGVTGASQTMPITMIVVVLAGVCGFAGKISIDSLGGDGFLWVFLWEILCGLHAFSNSCTPWLYKYLYGPSSKFYQTRSSSFLAMCSICARFSFHTFLVFGLPMMAGLLPFASLNELRSAFWGFWEADPIIGPY